MPEISNPAVDSESNFAQALTQNKDKSFQLSCFMDRKASVKSPAGSMQKSSSIVKQNGAGESRPLQ